MTPAELFCTRAIRAICRLIAEPVYGDVRASIAIASECAQAEGDRARAAVLRQALEDLDVARRTLLDCERIADANPADGA